MIPDLLLLQSMFFNPSVILTPPSLRTPPLYFAAQNTEEEGEMYFPFASAPILYVTPCNVTEHGRGRSFEVFFYYVIFVGEIRSI